MLYMWGKYSNSLGSNYIADIRLIHLFALLPFLCYHSTLYTNTSVRFTMFSVLIQGRGQTRSDTITLGPGVKVTQGDACQGALSWLISPVTIPTS